MANKFEAQTPSWRDAMSAGLGRAKTAGKSILGRGLDAFSQSYKNLFDRPEEDAEPDVSNMSEIEADAYNNDQIKKNFKVEKIRKKYKQMLNFEKDPLIRQRIKLEMEQKIRAAQGKKKSKAEDFMTGKGKEMFDAASSVSDDDVINPNYRGIDAASSPEEIARASAYNKSLGKSARWAKPAAAVGKGLGAFAASSIGGIPGMLAGAAVSKGLPMAADWWASRKAKQAEEADADERRYNPNRL